MSALAEALAAWRAVVGDEHVVSDEHSLTGASSTTFATLSKVRVIIRPANRDELCEVMRIASRFALAVYPSSRGGNWGLGARVPTRDGCALVDLRRMDRIVDFDEDMGFIRVQAGVTFAQACAFLAERGSRLMLDVSGSSPQTSIVGNSVERGHGLSFHSDRFANVCGTDHGNVISAYGERCA